MKPQLSTHRTWWLPRHKSGLDVTLWAGVAVLLSLSSCGAESSVEMTNAATQASDGSSSADSPVTATPPATASGSAENMPNAGPSAGTPTAPQLPGDPPVVTQPEPDMPASPTTSGMPNPAISQPEPDVPALPAAGGVSNAGGSSQGNGAAGEAVSAGGAGSSQGGAAPGQAGASAAGGASTGGAAVTPSTGCGASTWPSSDRYTIDVSGSSREYILDVPEDYDPNHPYRLIFGWHWRGGSADNVAGAGGPGGGQYYGLKSRAEGSAIFVAPEGLDAGWANSGGGDIEFLQAMMDRFQTELCIDQSRIFSTGFSYGGMMSLAVGCAMGDVFRAIAPMSGAFYSGCDDGDHPIAFWGSHGDNDEVVPLGDGEAGRDEFLARNHCDAQTEPVEPSPCVTYQGCDAGYPVTWCEFSGGHSPPDFSGQALWDFFSQF